MGIPSLLLFLQAYGMMRCWASAAAVVPSLGARRKEEEGKRGGIEGTNPVGTQTRGREALGDTMNNNSGHEKVGGRQGGTNVARVL